MKKMKKIFVGLLAAVMAFTALLPAFTAKAADPLASIQGNPPQGVYQISVSGLTKEQQAKVVSAVVDVTVTEAPMQDTWGVGIFGWANPEDDTTREVYDIKVCKEALINIMGYTGDTSNCVTTEKNFKLTLANYNPAVTYVVWAWFNAKADINSVVFLDKNGRDVTTDPLKPNVTLEGGGKYIITRPEGELYANAAGVKVKATLEKLSSDTYYTYLASAKGATAIGHGPLLAYLGTLPTPKEVDTAVGSSFELTYMPESGQWEDMELCVMCGKATVTEVIFLDKNGNEIKTAPQPEGSQLEGSKPQNSGSQGSADKTSPKTGDETAILLYGCLMAAAAAMVIVSRRRTAR